VAAQRPFIDQPQPRHRLLGPYVQVVGSQSNSGTVFDQVAAGALDDSRRDGPAAFERGVLAHGGGLVAQVADGVGDALAAVLLQPGGAGGCLQRGRDLFGATAEDAA
jgi:hypothetical protein